MWGIELSRGGKHLTSVKPDSELSYKYYDCAMGVYFLDSGVYRRLGLRAINKQTSWMRCAFYFPLRFLGRNVQCGSGRPEKHLTVAQEGRNSTPDVTVPGGFCCSDKTSEEAVGGRRRPQSEGDAGPGFRRRLGGRGCSDSRTSSGGRGRRRTGT